MATEITQIRPLAGVGYCFYCVGDQGASLLEELGSARAACEITSGFVDWIAPGATGVVASVCGSVEPEVRMLHSYLRRRGWHLTEEGV